MASKDELKEWRYKNRNKKWFKCERCRMFIADRALEIYEDECPGCGSAKVIEV